LIQSIKSFPQVLYGRKGLTMDLRIAKWEAEFREEIREIGFFDASCWYGMSNQPRRALIPSFEHLQEEAGRIGFRGCNVSNLISKYLRPQQGNSLVIDDINAMESSDPISFVPSVVVSPWAFDSETHFGEYLFEMLAAGVKSVRLFPRTHNYLLTDWSFGYVLPLIASQRLPLFVWTKEFDWQRIFEIAQAYPIMPVVVEQCDVEAFFNLGYIRPLLDECKNVYIVTNRMHEYAVLDYLVEQYGGSRFIFGSHIPLDDPYAQLAVVTMGLFSRQQKEQIAHENLEKLFSEVRS
jgi:uncharacterized protein